MDHKDGKIANDYESDNTIKLKMLRKGRLQCVDRMSTCITLRNGPLNTLIRDLSDSDLYVSCLCTRTDMIPHWIPSSEFQSHWLLGFKGNHKAEVKLMQTFLDYPFDMTNYYSTSYSQVSQS